MSDQERRQKTWRFPRFISEHAFDKLRLIDCTFAEFELALETAEVIEETPAAEGEVKELLLIVDWQRSLHAVVLVDEAREEERVITIYEPDPLLWTKDWHRRRT
jgi:hypothetical protein